VKARWQRLVHLLTLSSVAAYTEEATLSFGVRLAFGSMPGM
jgi:hypothetical protein